MPRKHALSGAKYSSYLTLFSNFENYNRDQGGILPVGLIISIHPG